MQCHRWPRWREGFTNIQDGTLNHRKPSQIRSQAFGLGRGLCPCGLWKFKAERYYVGKFCSAWSNVVPLGLPNPVHASHPLVAR
jgi:hypothetical protein